MKILYDSQTFTGQRFGGISGYFDKLITNRGDFYDYQISGRVSNNIYIPKFSDMKPFFDGVNFKGKLKLMKAINRRSDKKAIQKEDYDVFHPTYYEAVCYPEHKPVVITAHDFISELFKEGRDDSAITAYKHQAFQRAEKIICISENTRKDLLNLFPDIDEAKTELVWHALDWEVLDPITEEQRKHSYILFTGTRNHYKNFRPFVSAISPLLKQYDLQLICTGHDFSAEELQLFEELQIKDRVRHIFAASETDLQKLYHEALCFVFPSLYEGFGFPILEAFSSGCPLALSNASCFPEIAGDAGLFFDPKSEASMYSTIKKLIDDSRMCTNLIEKGYARLPLFSTSQLIEKTAAVYQKAMEYGSF